MTLPARPLPRDHRGFTLIELLVVIAILGILIGITVPVVGRVQENAKQSQCVSQLRQIATALNLYIGDNNGYLPAASPDPVAPATSAVLWTKALGPYIPLKGTSVTAREHAVFTCPNANYEIAANKEVGRTYAATAAMLGPNPLNPTNPAATAKQPRHLQQIVGRATTPLVVEGKQDGANNEHSRSNYNWPLVEPDILNATSPAETVSLDFRHQRRMNVLYADGSVRTISFSEMKKSPEDKERIGFTRPRWEGQ